VQAVLGTNILVANLRGGLTPSNDLKLVLADARAERFTLVVPGLVIEETVHRRRDAARAADRSLRKAHSDLVDIGAELVVPSLDLEAALSSP
jgi:hypothetical protein